MSKSIDRTTRGGIVLCGGASSRMGTSKAMLPFGEELMLQRVVRLLARVVQTEYLVVAAGPDQVLPELPPEVIVVCDERPGRGPLEGLRAGLAALPAGVEAAYATSCDVPLLVPAFVERMFERLGEYEIAVPRQGELAHPLSAVYRPGVLPVIERLLAADRLRAQSLLEECRTLAVPVEALREVDPELATLANLNRPEDYQAALARAGFAPRL